MSETQGFDSNQCKTPGCCTCDLPRCPACSYTRHDAAHLMDHDLCKGAIPPDPVASPPAPDAGAEAVAWQWRLSNMPCRWMKCTQDQARDYQNNPACEVRPLYASPEAALASAPGAATDDGTNDGWRDAPAPSLMRFGWAPGSYASKCDDCGSSYVGWSKATRCKDCAQSAATDFAMFMENIEGVFDPAPAPERDGESLPSGDSVQSYCDHLVALARIGARAAPAVADAGAVTFVEATEPGWYAVSHGTPRFCIYGQTMEEAREKADEAIRFYDAARATPRSAAPRADAGAVTEAQAEAICDAVDAEWSIRDPDEKAIRRGWAIHASHTALARQEPTR